MEFKLLIVLSIIALVLLSGCPEPLPECTEAWKCTDVNTRAYLNTDCSLSHETVCEFGCEAGECMPESSPEPPPECGVAADCEDMQSPIGCPFVWQCVEGECVERCGGELPVDGENGAPIDGETDGGVPEPDLCGNEIGNGNEIVHGALGPTQNDPDNPFRSLAVHPTNPDVVLVGTERNGFLKSTDGGKTWVRLRRGLRHDSWGYPEVYDVAIHGANPKIIYAATVSSPGPLTGNYPSSQGGVYKSTNGGESWQRKNCGLSNARVVGIHVSPIDPDNAIIGVAGGETSFTGFDVSGQYFDGGIFSTTDGGENWNRADIAQNDNKNSYSIFRAAGANPSLVYTFGMNWDDIGTSIGFLKSTDGGESWGQFAPDLRELGISYFDVSNDGTIIHAAPRDLFYLLKSVDGGGTWSEHSIRNGAYAIAVFPNDSDRVLFSQSDGIYLSTNGLETYSKAMDIDISESGNHVADIVIAPSDNGIAYVVTVGYNLYKSTDAGESFSKIINLREGVLDTVP